MQPTEMCLCAPAGTAVRLGGGGVDTANAPVSVTAAAPGGWWLAAGGWRGAARDARALSREAEHTRWGSKVRCECACLRRDV